MSSLCRTTFQGYGLSYAYCHLIQFTLSRPLICKKISFVGLHTCLSFECFRRPVTGQLHHSLEIVSLWYLLLNSLPFFFMVVLLPLSWLYTDNYECRLVQLLVGLQVHFMDLIMVFAGLFSLFLQLDDRCTFMVLMLLYSNTILKMMKRNDSTFGNLLLENEFMKSMLSALFELRNYLTKVAFLWQLLSL